jgi:hypothetical protein
MKEEYRLEVLEIKDELIKYLKGKTIENINSLWEETKNYFENKGIFIAGVCPSSGKEISVKYSRIIFKVLFSVSLDELKK